MKFTTGNMMTSLGIATLFLAGTTAVASAQGTAQKMDTARQPEMPESAIASGCIDFVLSPEDIAAEIVRICQPAAVA